MVQPAQNRSDPKELRATIENIGMVLRGWPEVLFAYVHGSFIGSEGTPGARSFEDVDIGVYVDPERVPAEEELDVSFAVADELDRVCAYPVDVQVINHAPVAFRYHVTEGVLLFTRSVDALSNFLERTWREYLDFRPVALQYLHDLA